MKKLFTFLSRANNNSVGVSLFNHRRVSSIYSMLTIVAIMLMVPQGVKAQEYRYYYYNFAEWANNVGGGPHNLPSGAQYGNTGLYYGTKSPTINGQVYDYMDFSRFAFRHDKGWKLRSNNGVSGLMFSDTQPLFVITNLYEGDEIKITYRSNNNDARHLYFVSGYAKLKWGDGNNLSSNYDFGATATRKDIELVATANGDITIKSEDGSGSYINHTYITYIEIKRLATDHWAYNPPATEIYNLNNSNGSITNNANATPDFTVDGVAGSFLYNTNGNALNNRLAVRNDFVGDFTKDGGLKNSSSSNYAQVLSIANLNAGDRVRITYNGYIRFGSDHDCTTLSSEAHNEEMNDGQLMTADGEHMIQPGEVVDGQLFYTMDVAGHLDLVLSPGAVITKIEIYSDYPTTMLDKENGMANGSFNGYTSYFAGNGVLDNKEHIVPGGLHVFFGADSENEKAYVIQTDDGPASYINDYQGFKMARNSSNTIYKAAPVTGTYYRFTPEVNGTIHFTFKAQSIRYTPSDIYWNPQSQENVLNHEEVASSGQQCPYALFEQYGSNYTQKWSVGNFTVNNQMYGSGGASTGTLVTDNGNIHVEAGRTYYLYGNWNGDFAHGGYCGVAELIDVTFIPNAYVYPLAKWVDNATEEDDNLASVSSGTTTSQLFVKKMTGNITGCTPYITSDHKLAVKDITYGNDANKGGVILIKVGDINNDDDPVFALTVAYSAEQGHTWDFHTKPLNGLKWETRTVTTTYNSELETNVNTVTPATKEPYGTYYQDWFAGNTNKNTNSLLYQEIDGEANAGGSPDWNFQYRLTRTNSSGGKDYLDPMFVNMYNLEGDNADMYYETEGLVIMSSSSMNCFFNEYKHTPTAAELAAVPDLGADEITHLDEQANIPDPDRYIGLMTGSELIIPKLKKDDRVIIYMGAGSGEAENTMFFNITNARDAVYNEIDPNDLYHPGGSMWNANANNNKYAHGDHNYRGCYHFFAKEDGDMVFKLNEDYNNVLCKLYSIQIYRGDRISTNSVNKKTNNVDTYLFVSTQGDNTRTTNHYTMHYLGKGEIPADGKGKEVKKSLSDNSETPHKENCEFITTSGHITNTDLTVSNNDISYTNVVGDFGDARVRLKCLEMGRKYVADIADRNLTMAYKEKVDAYPYTWDFTDIQTFSGSKLASDNAIPENADYAKDAKGYDLSLWDENGYMIVREKEFIGDNTYEIFQQNKGGGGNQLRADDVIIPETRGLWFYFDNNDGLYNGCMQITNEQDGAANGGAGIHLINTGGQKRGEGDYELRGWWNYKMIVPDVPAGAAVYLRMARDGRVSEDAYTHDKKDKNSTEYVDNYFLQHKFQFDHMDSKMDLNMASSDEVTGINYKYRMFQADDNTGDYIVAIKDTRNVSEAASNLTFTLNGWTLKKLAISEDPKTVNVKGWASESRDHDIDASLTAYLTGKVMKSYLVSNPDYKKRTLTLTDMGSASTYVIPANTGYVIYNSTDANVLNILDSGFHLFVPDMHDDEESEGKFADVETNNGFMVPVLEERTGENKLKSFSSDGKKTNYVLSYKWYDLTSDGSTTGQQHMGDEMFYRVSREGINLRANSAYLVLDTESLGLKTSQGSTQSAKFTFIFADDLFGQSPGITTGIDDASQLIDNGQWIIDNDAEWYNLSGQKLNGMPTTKGLYIVNGKKVLVK